MRWIIPVLLALLLAGCGRIDVQKTNKQTEEQLKFYLDTTKELDRKRKAENAKNQAEWEKMLKDNGFDD